MPTILVLNLPSFSCFRFSHPGDMTSVTLTDQFLKRAIEVVRNNILATAAVGIGVLLTLQNG
jgi:hypothetical protein